MCVCDRLFNREKKTNKEVVQVPSFKCSYAEAEVNCLPLFPVMFLRRLCSIAKHVVAKAHRK